MERVLVVKGQKDQPEAAKDQHGAFGEEGSHGPVSSAPRYVAEGLYMGDCPLNIFCYYFLRFEKYKKKCKP